MKKETIKKIIDVTKLMYKDYIDSQKVAGSRKDNYLPVFEELIIDANEYESRINAGDTRLDNTYTIKYINQLRNNPKYPSLRYLFDADLEPGKYYKEIPISDNKDLRYDICYFNGEKKIKRRVVDGGLCPTEMLYYYTDKHEIEIIIKNREDRWIVTGLSKIEFNDEGKVSSIKKMISEDSADMNFKLWKKGRLCSFTNVSVENYRYMNNKLVEFSINDCSNSFPIYKSVKIDKISWKISETNILIERDNEDLPVSYTSVWNEWWWGFRSDEEKHFLTKRQIAKILSFDNMNKSL